MSDSILQQLQHHADRLSGEVAEQRLDATNHPNGPPDLITALQRVEKAAKAVVEIAHASGEGKSIS